MEAVWGSRDPLTTEARTRLLQHTTDLFKRNVFMCTPTTLIHHIGFFFFFFFKKGKWNTEELSFIWQDLQRSGGATVSLGQTQKRQERGADAAFLVHPEMEIWDCRTNSRRRLESIQGYHLSRANYQQPQPLWNSDVMCLFLLVKQSGIPKHVTETEITLQWIHKRSEGEFHEEVEHSPIGWPVVDTHTPLGG